jgi:hypothetical protein
MSSKPVWSAHAAPAPIDAPAILTAPCQTPGLESRRGADETPRAIGAAGAAAAVRPREHPPGWGHCSIIEADGTERLPGPSFER